MTIIRTTPRHRWRRMGGFVLAVTVACLAARLLVPAKQPVAVAPAGAGIPLPIIMYHSIVDELSRIGPYVISPAELESDLRYLQRQGYQTVTVADLLRHVEEGAPLPEKPVMLTFDDGQYNNYLYAYPLLRQYGMQGVLSPVVQWSEDVSGKPKEQNHAVYSYLTWAQLKEMSDSGVMEIQNHSYAMHDSTKGRRKGITRMAGEGVETYQQVLQADLTKAQSLLAAQDIPAPTTLTYPFGAMCKEALPVLEALGFRATLTCESRINRITSSPDCLMGLGRHLRPGGKSSEALLEPILRACEG